MSDLVKALGVKVRMVDNLHENENVVLLSDLHAALEKLPTVWGVYGFHKDKPKDFSCDTYNIPGTSTHTARLLCIEEIKREPLKHEFKTEVKENNSAGMLYFNMIPGSFIGKRVRVTVEEI